MSIEQEGFTISDLQIQKLNLLDRIQRIEKDLRCPLDTSMDEQAIQIGQQLIMMRLLEVEKSNLRKLNFEIEKRQQNTLKQI